MDYEKRKKSLLEQLFAKPAERAGIDEATRQERGAQPAFEYMKRLRTRVDDEKEKVLQDMESKSAPSVESTMERMRRRWRGL